MSKVHMSNTKMIEAKVRPALKIASKVRLTPERLRGPGQEALGQAHHTHSV